MAIAKSGGHSDVIGGVSRPLSLRNGEIERFEEQYTPFGIFALYDQLMGNGRPQVRHVRDIVALALVGGGLSDKGADDVLASLGPEHNFALIGVARRLLGVTFAPYVLDQAQKKSADGSPESESGAGATQDTTSPAGSGTSAA